MKKRYLLVALLLALAFLASCSVALADDGIDVPPVELISDNPNFSIVDWHLNVMPLADELKLTRMTASISKSDSSHVYVKGVTEANKICYRIGGYMTIQQWKDNQWNKYTTASYHAYDTSEASGSGTLSVASGYYYRVIIDHQGSASGGTASGVTTTKSVLVN